jgi:hypothetical protein
MILKTIYSLLIMLIFSVNSAFARDSFKWGGYYGGIMTESSITLVRAETHFANLIITNRLSPNLLIDRIVLSIDDVEVIVTYDDRSGSQPDAVTVTIPPGYYILPNREEFIIHENDTMIIEIHQMLLG